MAGSHETERRLLDTITDLAADVDGADVEELDEVLRAYGVEPEGLKDRIIGRVRQRTWKTNARQERARRRVDSVPARPVGTDRAGMMAELNKKAGAGRFFRNAEELSDDDLWQILCQQRELEDDTKG